MDPVLLVVVASSVVATLGVSYAGYVFFFPERSAADRISEIATSPDPRSDGPIQKVKQLSTMAQRVARLASSDEAELTELRKKLMQADYRDRNAVEIFAAVRAVGAILGGLLLFLIFPKSKIIYMVGSALVGAAAGYYMPMIWITNVVQKRQTELLKAFPDALDLLVSSVEAGLGVDAAFKRVADEMDMASPKLSRELQMVTHEVNGGMPRTEALRRLADRTGLDDINSLVNVLVQAERFGTSISRALRTHSEHVRTKRMQKAEAKAAQVSPKLTVVMIIFILPCLIIILIGPAIINIKNVLLPTAGGISP